MNYGYEVTCRNVYKYCDWKRKEHMAVRNTAGWYYWTHQLVEVKGKDAAAFLDYLYPNNIASLKVSRDRYTVMVNEEGLIIDDVVIMHIEEDLFWVSTLYAVPLMAWMEAHKGEYEVEWRHITAEWDMYAVQGPRSKDMVNAIVKNPVDEQKFFQVLDNEIDGIPVKINRGGFTGEKLGYEIYVAPEKKGEIEAKLREEAPAFEAEEVEEFQIMALSLPTEKGFYLMCDIQWANPFEVGLAGNINWDKEFIGKEALLKVKEEGPARELVGFTADSDDVHINSKERGGPGNALMIDGEEVGRATKWTYSYVLEKNIGYALIDKSLAKIGDRVMINDNPATLTEKVFI